MRFVSAKYFIMGKWTIVFALFIINFVDLGIIKSFGVLMDELVAELDSDVRTIGTILGMYHGLASMLAPLITPVLGYIPMKCLAVINTVGSLFLVLLSTSPNDTVFAVFAVGAGVCYAFVFTSMILRFCATEDNYFALAYGLQHSGSAAGMMILPVFSDFLLETYGWRGCIAILGAISFHTTPLILLAGEPTDNNHTHVKEESHQKVEHVAEVALKEERSICFSLDIKQCTCKHQDGNEDQTLRYVCFKMWLSVTWGFKKLWNYFGLSLLTDIPYSLFLNLGFLMVAFINTAWVIFLIPHGVAKGIPLSRAVFFAISGGIGQFIGRIIQGPIVDRKWLTSVDLTIIMSIISALSFCLDPLFHKFEIICILAFIGGLVNGTRLSLTVVILKQFIPSERFEKAYSLNCLFFGLGEPFGGLVSGSVAAAFNFDIAYEVLGIVDLLLAVTLIGINYFLPKPAEMNNDQGRQD